MKRASRGYVVAIRRNGSTCGCTGPYTSRKVAEQEAGAIRATLGNVETVVLGVRDNGFSEAWSRLSGAYREAGRATAEVGREAAAGVKAAPARAVKAVKAKAAATAAEAKRRVEAAAEERREKQALALAEEIESLGYVVTLRKQRKNTPVTAALAAMEAKDEAKKAARAAVREVSRSAGDVGEALAELVHAATKHRKNSRARSPRARKAR